MVAGGADRRRTVCTRAHVGVTRDAIEVVSGSAADALDLTMDASCASWCVAIFTNADVRVTSDTIQMMSVDTADALCVTVGTGRTSRGDAINTRAHI